MRHEPGLDRFRIAFLAIAAMIMVSGAGAMSSYLLIDNSIAIDRVASWSPTHDDPDCWPCPDDALEFLVSGQFPEDLTAWSDLEEEIYTGDPGSTANPNAVDAAEITFPILTVLAVVATAQRLSEARGASYGRAKTTATWQHRSHPPAKLTPNATPPSP